jgi:hypothetical protein
MRLAYIYAGCLAIFGCCLLLMAAFNSTGNHKLDLDDTQDETPALSETKIEDRAPVDEAPARKGGATSRRPTHGNEKHAPPATLTSPQLASDTWNYDGSTLRLEGIGRTKRLYYVAPRNGVPAKGGDIAFEVVREGPRISGLAYQFAENCPPFPYLVRGNVSADEASLKMTGRKPQRDGQCKIVGYSESELVIRLASKL